MRISDWSSDVCSSDLDGERATFVQFGVGLMDIEDVSASSVERHFCRASGATLIIWRGWPDSGMKRIRLTGVSTRATIVGSGGAHSRQCPTNVQPAGGTDNLSATTLRSHEAQIEP